MRFQSSFKWGQFLTMCKIISHAMNSVLPRFQSTESPGSGVLHLKRKGERKENSVGAGCEAQRSQFIEI